MFRSLLFIAIVSIPALAQDSAAIKDALNREIHGTKLLRHFYANPFLHYAWTPSGLVAQDGISRFWSTDGFVKIKSVKLKGDQVEIKADGLTIVFDPKQSDIRFKSYAQRRITFPARSAGDVRRAAKELFVSPDEDLSAMVRPHWRMFVATHRILDFPAKESLPEPKKEKPAKEKDPSVTPPQAIYAPNGQFSNVARFIGYEGKSTLKVEIDENGNTYNIEILEPAGAGLDEQAVSALENWRFKPAMKDGKPVRTRVAVEMKFELSSWF